MADTDGLQVSNTINGSDISQTTTPVTGVTGSGDGTGVTQVGVTPPVTFATYEEYYAAQPETVRKLIDERNLTTVKGLKDTLTVVRNERDNIDKQLKEALTAVKSGGDAASQLQVLVTQLENQRLANVEIEKKAIEASHKAEFFKSAAALGCNNVGLLYVAAKEDNMIGEDGTANFDKLKKLYAQLFVTAVKPGDAKAGSGIANPQVKTELDLNRWFRTGQVS